MGGLDDLTKPERRLLESFVRYSIKRNVSNVTLSMFHDTEMSLKIPALFVEGTLQKLCDRAVLQSFQDDHNQMSYKITPSYLDDIMELAIQWGLIENEDLDLADLSIPASDRFVDLSDNAPDLVEAKEALVSLSAAIRDSNSLIANADDRLQISKEIDHIKEVISAPRVHVLAVYDSINSNRTLRWLCEQAASGVVRQAAITACKCLVALLAHLNSIF